MRRSSRLLALAILAASAFAGSAQAGDNSSFYFNSERAAPWQGPACDAPAVTNRVVERFNSVEAEYWKRGLQMASVVGARELSTNQWDPPLIAARHCTATAYFADGSRRHLVYWMRSEQGFAGVGWGLQYCVVGVYQHMAYAPECRMLRPL